MQSEIILEACVDSIEGALAAEAGGAGRIELCAALSEGGLTPSAGVIAVARQRVGIAAHVMIRPRGGDFLYTDVEFAAMQRDAEMAKRLGAAGVVFGLLLPDSSIDLARTRQLVEQSQPMSVTFHRAFDMTADPEKALTDLIALGVDRVLTSGQAPIAAEGIDLLTTLVKQAGDEIVVIPGGGIDEMTLAKILAETGASEIHVTGTREVDSGMTFRNPRLYMGREPDRSEFSTVVADADRVRAMVELARRSRP
ncbi:MAG: copper homeostasis protein CutC [Vicinamibacterales bacterium]|jgi:copper homeostasis protein|nr:copper homeostasis protein CutC [Acidobacteriota bacterium]MDP7295710.1 copper homeostasis protein CutC [Vicinamibacterales bacterium]MDP7471957.1 copper homeostasis protein CutC [Vicinamibacterales bacterium]MDP7670981.1 copper homeostasis protein CutC [Vicinamibacterales bacterium]HJO38774.1 copper homeostasis protein CutC [Vicinamibacterales bacterium]|tara:strand:- start:473 stop:1231 length:759 start_codon:yes stop_codon:yes gene_type:complete